MSTRLTAALMVLATCVAGGPPLPAGRPADDPQVGELPLGRGGVEQLLQLSRSFGIGAETGVGADAVRFGAQREQLPVPLVHAGAGAVSMVSVHVAVAKLHPESTH